MIIKMILTNSFSPDVRVYKEAKYLISKGNDVEILCWDKEPERGLPKTENIEGIHVTRFGIASVAGSGYKQMGAYKKYILSCREYLRGKEYDILHCHDLDGAIIGNRIKAKYIFDMHEFYNKGSSVGRFFSDKLAKKLARNAYANICVADISIKTYGKGIENKFFMLKNYSDPSSFQNTQKSESDVLRISYIGKVRNQIPDFTALFEAASQFSDVEVNVYGDGVDLPQLLEMESKYNNVNIHGAFDGINQSSEIYEHTDISYIAYDPSNPNYQNEFEPVKLYEAIFTGTPILATESINPGRVTKEKKIGLAVDTRDVNQLKEAIEYFKEHRDYMAKCTQNMRDISAAYDWNEAVKILDTVYANYR